jgi:peptide deformylase
MRELVTVDNDINNILYKYCGHIVKFGKPAQDIIDNMFFIMKKYNGVGLAAPQIGIPARIIIAGDTAYINPDIVSYSEEKNEEEEGCLSVPGVTKSIERSKVITLRYQDVHRRMHVKVFTELVARIIQHEVDHLNGKWII